MYPGRSLITKLGMLQKMSGPTESNEQQQQAHAAALHEAHFEEDLAGNTEHSAAVDATMTEQVQCEPYAICDVVSSIVRHSCTVFYLLQSAAHVSGSAFT